MYNGFMSTHCGMYCRLGWRMAASMPIMQHVSASKWLSQLAGGRADEMQCVRFAGLISGERSD
jgi:hypothetical protein